MAFDRPSPRLGACLRALALGLGIALLACGGADEEPAAPGSTSTPSAGTPQATTPAGESLVVEQTTGELPKAYPSDLPIYPGADAETSMLVPGMGGIVTFATDAAPSEVVAFFQEQLPAQGWSVEESSAEPPRLRASKGERRATIAVKPREEDTEISLALEGL